MLWLLIIAVLALLAVCAIIDWFGGWCLLQMGVMFGVFCLVYPLLKEDNQPFAAATAGKAGVR